MAAPKLYSGGLLRHQVLAMSIVAFVFYTVVHHFETPFHPALGYVGFSSGVMHVLLFIFFKRLFPMNLLSYSILSTVNMIFLGLAVHFTGGVLSPFIFVFFFLVMSETINGSANQFGFLSCLAVYVLIVFLEWKKILPVHSISTEDIYSSPLGLGLSATAFVVFISIVGESYKRVIAGLRESLEKEHDEKEKAHLELAKMDAPAQLGLIVNKIVHDLRGPLGAIAGFIHVLKNENELNKESQEDCMVMLTELERISNMLNRLIVYAKPNHMELQRVCLVDVMETVLSVIVFSPGAKRIRFERRFPEPGTGSIHATKEELQQVFFNILKNAIEALEKIDRERIIKCAIYYDAKNAVVEIDDNGDGIPKHMLGKLDIGLSTKKQGAGLGLSIVREILDRYEGSMKMTSEEGHGTRVTVTLPLYSESDTLTVPKKGVNAR